MYRWRNKLRQQTHNRLGTNIESQQRTQTRICLFLMYFAFIGRDKRHFVGYLKFFLPAQGKNNTV